MVREVAGIVPHPEPGNPDSRYHGNQTDRHQTERRHGGNHLAPPPPLRVGDKCPSSDDDPFYPSSDPLTASDPYSIEDPPSYEESVEEDWNANLTWPNALATRDDLAQIFRLNNYDYSTRGRAFTVSGPPETHLPRYRNIINYFENSLENMSSVEWSGGGSVQSRVHRMSSAYPSTDIEPNILSRSGPKPHKIGAHTSSRDVIHWDYINEINPNTATRFTVRVVPNMEENPPNYSDHVVPGNSLSDCRPCPTTGTCDTNTCNDTTRHCTLNKDQEAVSTYHGVTQTEKRGSLKKQPSAPSLEQIQEPPVARRHSSVYELGRTYTAPARLEKEDEVNPAAPPPIPDAEDKTVSFYMGEKGPSDSSIGDSSTKVESAHTRPYPEIQFHALEKNETITSETGDSGYDDESCLMIREITPPPKFADVKRENYTVRIEADGSKARLVTEPLPVQVEEWENHRLFNYQKPPRRLSWKFWAGLLFFLCDILLVLTGTLLLVTNYHDNIIPGFVLLGLGIGMCIPALNYLGGLSTVCARIEGARSADVFI